MRVVAQIAFPPILSIPEPSAIAAFQERIRADYPETEKSAVQYVDLSDNRPQSVRSETIWRFFDTDHNWRISLAPAFVALDVSRYSNRQDFVARLASIGTSLAETINPRVVTRVGLRYVDRIAGKDLEHLTKLIKGDFLAPSRTAFAEAAQHMVTEAVLKTQEDANLLARWGTLPPRATFDPEVMEPISEASFILDLDMSSAAKRAFEPDALTGTVERFAERIYGVFRYMVTDEFLRHYGGEP